MKILSAEQIRELDKYTIEHEPVASIDLMERAVRKVTECLKDVIPPDAPVYIFCGMGNNGGDGLVVGRQLLTSGYKAIHLLVVKHSGHASVDFLANQERLKDLTVIQYIESEDQIPTLANDAVIVDAIFGSGLSRAV